MSPVGVYTLIMSLLTGFNVKNTLTYQMWLEPEPAWPEPSVEEKASRLNNWTAVFVNVKAMKERQKHWSRLNDNYMQHMSQDCLR